MSSEWTENGPVSLPPRSIAYGAGVLVVLVGLAGLGFGFKTGMHSSQPGAADASARVAADGSTEEAKPIVVLPPPVTAPAAATAAPKKDDADSSTDDKEAQAQAAAAQQVQGKGKSGQDIDDILTSSSEKPPAPTKPSNDEAPPTRSDVPY